MWCYLPETDCLFAAEPVDWIWASVSPIQAFTHDALSNGKNTPGKASSPHSAQGISPQPRYGTTLPHSTQSPSEAHSIPSLPGIPASHLATRDSAKAQTIPATSGHTSPASSSNWTRDGCSSKTSQGTSALALRPCCENYGAWATRLRLAHSQRLKLAQRTSASDGSAWPTATVCTGSQTAENPTPGQTGGTSLSGAAEMWPTAQARDFRSGDNPNSPRQARKLEQGWSQNLNDVAEAAQWPTPMAGTPAQNGNSAAGNNDFTRKAEELAAAMWGTPRASDAEKGGPNMKFGSGGTPLPAQAAQWPTPAAQNHKGSSPDSVTRADGKSRMDILHYAAEQGFSHPDQATPQHGPTLSQILRIWRHLRASVIATHKRATWRRLMRSRTKRRLNPLFVEWLMGWPPGHALCDCSETEFAQFQQRMRGALSALPTASGPWIWKPPAQTAPEQTQMEMF